MARNEVWKYLGIPIPWARSVLQTEVKYTSSRGKFDRAIAWIKFVGGGRDLAGRAVGNLIVELVKKGE